MIYPYLITALIFVSGVSKIYSQTLSSQIDSLRSILTTAKDTNLANAYQRLGVLYTNQLDHLDSAKFFIEKCLELSSKLAYDKGVAWGYMLKSNIFITERKHSEALFVAQKAYAMFSLLKMPAQAAQALYTIGLVYNNVGDMNNAAKFYLEAAQTFEQYAPQHPALSTAYINLATGLARLSRYEESVQYSKKAIFIAQQNKEVQREILAAVNLVGNLVILRQFDSAKVYANKALELSTQIKFVHGIIRSLVAQSNISLKEGNFEQVINIGTEVIAKANEYNKTEYIANSSMRIAEAFDSLRQYDKALVFAKQGVQYAKEIPDPWSNMLVNQAQSHEVISSIYKKLSNPALALFHLEESKKLRDSSTSLEKEQQLNALVNLYESKRKEAQLAELSHKAEVQELDLRQKNTAILGGSIGGVLMVIVGVLFYRQRRLQAEQRIAQTESRLLRTRLNPHLWFNALSSVQHHLLTGANPRSSAQYLSKIASVMRQSLESSYQDMVTIAEEVEFAEKYLSIQQMRLQEAFEYSVQIHDSLDPDVVRVPSMLLEPFLENTIEHGFKEIRNSERIEKARIHIVFEETPGTAKNAEKLLSVIIEDNGSGLQNNETKPESTTAEAPKHRSRAVEITKERLRLLAPKNAENIGVTIAERPEGGVSVQIILPMNEV